MVDVQVRVLHHRLQLAPAAQLLQLVDRGAIHDVPGRERVPEDVGVYVLVDACAFLSRFEGSSADDIQVSASVL